MAKINGEKDAFYSQFNQSNTIPNVVVAYVEGRPVGCGAHRPVDDHASEIKRMYVDPELRGSGIGKAILAELESWVSEQGFAKAVLETSKRLDTAVGLYAKAGYQVIPNYGPYVDAPDSVCMEKLL